MAAPVAALPSLLVMGAAMAFVVYRRARQQIGRQTLRPGRMKARMVILCVIATLVVTLATIASLTNLAGAVGGAVIGTALALYALRLTHIERTPEGVFYTGNVYIGLAVSVLLIGRVAYRFVTMPAVQASPGTAPPDFQTAMASSFGNPLTIAILLVTVGYYVVYYAGLLREARKAGQTDAAAQ